MESVKIEELVEEKRVSLIQKATNSLNRLTETMKSLVEEVERMNEDVRQKEKIINACKVFASRFISTTCTYNGRKVPTWILSRVQKMKN